MQEFQELTKNSTGNQADGELDIIPKFVEDVEMIQKCVEDGLLPKVVMVAPPGSIHMLPRVKRLYQIFTAMCKKAGIPMILCGMTLQLYTLLRRNVTGIPAPAAWRFFAEVAMCLSYVGISPNIQLTRCDIMAFDIYDAFLHMIESLGMSPTVMDGPAYCGPRMFRMIPMDYKNPGGIKQTTIFAEAFKTAGKAPSIYEKVLVPRQGWFGGSRRADAWGVLPEPARAMEPEQQPGATKNGNLQMLRKVIRREVIEKAGEFDAWSKWDGIGNRCLYNLFQTYPQDFGQMTTDQFFNGIAEAWQKDNCKKRFKGVTDEWLTEIFEKMGSLTYAQIESLIIVIGERRFIEMGPMEVFGVFFEYILPEEAQTIAQGTDGAYYETQEMISAVSGGRLTQHFSQKLGLLRKGIATVERNLAAILKTSQGPPKGDKEKSEKKDFNEEPCRYFNLNNLGLGLRAHLPSLLGAYPDIMTLFCAERELFF